MRSAERQTLIALKARRTAFRVVTDFLHVTDLDVHEGICTQCGAVLPQDCEGLSPSLCPRCDHRELEVTESARQWEEQKAWEEQTFGSAPPPKMYWETTSRELRRRDRGGLRLFLWVAVGFVLLAIFLWCMQISSSH